MVKKKDILLKEVRLRQHTKKIAKPLKKSSFSWLG